MGDTAIGDRWGEAEVRVFESGRAARVTSRPVLGAEPGWEASIWAWGGPRVSVSVTRWEDCRIAETIEVSAPLADIRQVWARRGVAEALSAADLEVGLQLCLAALAESEVAA